MKLWWKLQQWCWDIRDWRDHRGQPDDMVKAQQDPFTYALAMRDGSLFLFESLEMLPHGWARLTEPQHMHVSKWEGEGRFTTESSAVNTFARGVTIRVSDIVWIADCPEGS